MNIYKFLGKSFNCKYCGQRHYVPIKKIITRENAIFELSSFIKSLAIKCKNILILCDNITYEVAGKTSEGILRNDYKISTLILKPINHKIVYADAAYFPLIKQKSSGKNLIITVGSGSITDMGKFIGSETGIPVISVPTAPSMNAYTSGVAAFISRGVKLTFPVKPAIGVIIDTDIISDAPMDLIKAGFADSLAKSFANADWKISSILTGEKFCSLPLKITTAAEKTYKDRSDRLLKRDKKVISSLMEGLNMGGFSMIIAGKSAPASGGEHLISHFLDMFSHKEGKEVFSYHGLQVGIGIVVSSIIYEMLRGIRNPVLKKISYDNKIKEFFGTESKIIKKEFYRKIRHLKNIPRLWDEFHKVFSTVPSSEEIKIYLKKAGCPVRFSDIRVSKKLAQKSLMSARYIRGRVTILDIADELGILKEVSEMIQ